MDKIKTLAEYQQLASRTCPDLGSNESNLLHMNLGIITEIGEFLDAIKKNIAYKKPLDTVNLGEELADIAWYVANKARLFFPLSWEEQEKDRSTYVDIKHEFETRIIPKLLTLHPSFKDEYKIIVLLHLVLSPDEEEFLISEVKSSFNGVRDMAVLNHIAEMYNLDFWQILTNNIAKLQKRYPEKFTEEAALNRDLEAERVELERKSDD